MRISANCINVVLLYSSVAHMFCDLVQYKYILTDIKSFTAELVVDKAMELKFVGGVFGGNIKPTPFLCLTLKMLQIQPEKDIIVEFIKNEDFKWVHVWHWLALQIKLPHIHKVNKYDHNNECFGPRIGMCGQLILMSLYILYSKKKLSLP